MSGTAESVAEVETLLGKLRNDLSYQSLQPQERLKTLERLKVLGRVAENAGPIFTTEGITTLAKLGFDDATLSVSQEALRCLANALLLRQQTRQIFVDAGFVHKAALRLRSDDRQNEFLLSRIMFLLTYNTTTDFKDLVANHKLAETVDRNMYRHSERLATKLDKSEQPSAIADLALCETLKLIFNITHFHADLSPVFSSCIPHILKILHDIELPRRTLDPPVSFLISSLINLDLKQQDPADPDNTSIFPVSDRKLNVARLVSILDSATLAYAESELDHDAAPLVALLRRIHALADDDVKSFMRSALLPCDDERDQPLGKSDTFSARLLRLTVSPTAPDLRDSISALLYELCDSDTDKFVQTVGYGFAAGFLMNQRLPFQNNVIQAQKSDNDGEQSSSMSINPITGQRLDAEPVDTGPPMTDEEKEREAERLFVLFERLKKTGVMTVKNPVEQAVDEGRFQELD